MPIVILTDDSEYRPMHPCADDYEFIAITDPGEAAAVGCEPGDTGVIRRLGADLGPPALEPGAVILVRYANGDNGLRRWGADPGSIGQQPQADGDWQLIGVLLTHYRAGS